jgi:hypothetical protein
MRTWNVIDIHSFLNHNITYVLMEVLSSFFFIIVVDFLIN